MSEPGAALYAADELSEKVGRRRRRWAVRLAREEQVELQRGRTLNIILGTPSATPVTSPAAPPARRPHGKDVA